MKQIISEDASAGVYAKEGICLNILVTLDRRYVLPLNVMLTSLFLNNPDERFDIYIASGDLTDEDLVGTKQLCGRFCTQLHLIPMAEAWFAEAPTVRYYSRAMYYRLLAAQYLPEDMKRVLYLDPDMLIINSLRPLYGIEMEDHLYAACIHKRLVNLSEPINKVRLSTYEAEGYFNSGVLLMNLPAIRKNVHPEAIFEYVKKNRQFLILPDQDVLNGLYGENILSQDDTLWNYDARRYNEYLIASSGEKDMNWVMQHTAILHYCGKRKPWQQSSSGRFVTLYKHYMQLSKRFAPD